MKPLIASTVLILALTGCGSWHGSGVVTGKEHRPQHMVMIPVGCGKGVTCMIPQTKAECFWIKVKAADGEHDGCVDRDIWDKAIIGKAATIPERK